MKFLKKFDYFGLDLPLPLQNSKKFQTNIGGLATIACIIFSVLSFIYFSNDLIEKNNPTILEFKNQIELNSNQRNDLKKNNIFFAFSLFRNDQNKNFINESYYTVSLVIYNKNISIDNFVHKTALNLTPCKEEYIPKNKIVYEYYKNKLNYLFCLKPKDYNKLFLSGTWLDDNFQTFEIQYKYCKESVNKTCANQSELKNVFSSYWIEIFFIDIIIDPTNYKNPNQINPVMHTFYLSEGEMKNIRIEYISNEVKTDSGFLFPNINKKEYWNIYSENSETHKLASNDFGSITIICSKYKKIVKRSYDKIPKILAEVGGILNIIFLVVKIGLDKIFQLIFYKKIINEYYFYENNESLPENQKEKKKKISKKKIKIKKRHNSKKNESIDFEIESEVIKENEINQINIPNKVSIALINSLKSKITKLKTTFWEIFKLIFFKKKKETEEKNKILKTAIDDFEKKIQLDYIVTTFKELDLIKKFLFDQNQINILDMIPKYVIFKNLNDQKNQNTNIENINHYFKKINEKQNKNYIDYNILRYSENLKF